MSFRMQTPGRTGAAAITKMVAVNHKCTVTPPAMRMPNPKKVTK